MCLSFEAAAVFAPPCHPTRTFNFLRVIDLASYSLPLLSPLDSPSLSSMSPSSLPPLPFYFILLLSFPFSPFLLLPLHSSPNLFSFILLPVFPSYAVISLATLTVATNTTITATITATITTITTTTPTVTTFNTTTFFIINFLKSRSHLNSISRSDNFP